MCEHDAQVHAIGVGLGSGYLAQDRLDSVAPGIPDRAAVELPPVVETPHEEKSDALRAIERLEAIGLLGVFLRSGLLGNREDVVADRHDVHRPEMADGQRLMRLK
ncbi:MAG TPA: hypothetical protein VGT79_08515 [Xanthomonadaceae bacterium]|nr:hypothetical protein [Xanthomonadaceae bacterium]